MTPSNCTCGGVLAKGGWRVDCPAADEHRRARDAAHKLPRRLSTRERHQLAADNGHDTWEDYRGER